MHVSVRDKILTTFSGYKVSASFGTQQFMLVVCKTLKMLGGGEQKREEKAGKAVHGFLVMAAKFYLRKWFCLSR